MDIDTVDIESTPYLYVAGEAPMDPGQVSAAMDRCFGRLMAFMREHGIAPAGPPMSVYHGYDENKLAFRAAMAVSPGDIAKAGGDVKADETPGGKVFGFVHAGPYADLGASYEAATAVLAESGQSFGAPTWEIYLNDPAETPPEDLRTQIYTVPGGPQ